MPLSTDDFILTRRVVNGAIDPEPVAIAIRAIIEISPCGEDPGWSDVVLYTGAAVEEITIATPFGMMIPTSDGAP